MPNPPEMSIIVITPDSFKVVARTMKCLREQTARERLEVVIVAPSRAKLQLDESQLSCFCQILVVEVGSFKSTAEARVAGIRQASAPIVALTEDHCFPEPGWAAALIDAHRESIAAAGPVFLNANPNTLTSWSNLLVEYGPWLEPVADVTPNHLPGHNGSYKRNILLQYGERLQDLMEAESTLHWDLRHQGYTLRIEPAAKTRHLNFAFVSSSLKLRFNGGRLFAASRARQWSSLRRLIYAAASPLIPMLRLRRALADIKRIGRQDLMPSILPVLMIILTIDGLGELTGYLLGAGRSMERLRDLEFHRERYITKTNGEHHRSI